MNWEFVREVGLGNFVRRKLARQFCKRILRRDNSLRLANGFRFPLPRNNKFATEAYITRGNVDWGAEELLRQMIEPGGDFLDVGAHIGYYSAVIHDLCRSVHAFEPDPRNLALLTKACARLPNVTVVPMAVGDRIGWADFVLADTSAVSHLAASEGGGGENDRREKVPLVTVDEYCRLNPLKVTGIKIDVEGSDLSVISGARGTFARDQPLALAEIEWSPALPEVLAPLGYSTFATVRNKVSRKAIFRRIDSVLPPDQTTKMLFLVPHRLIDRFVARCDRGT
jgi:FkbM family methyltransferase